MATAVNYFLAGGIGALLGIAELLARYRDKPTRIARRVAAWTYVLLNAVASVVALTLIRQFGWTFGQEDTAAIATAQVLVAGLGAAVLFRSSLFLFKVGDENVGLGPSVLLTSLLGAADRSVDRDQAGERLRSAGETLQNVSFVKAKDALVTAALAASANVSAEESASLRQAVKALESEASMTDAAKTLVLGMLIIDVVGAGVLEETAKQLGDEIK
jgi:hypothetical protein